MPQADYDTGRAARGYLCNTRQVAHEGTSGGFKVLRYRDDQGSWASNENAINWNAALVLLLASQLPE